MTRISSPVLYAACVLIWGSTWIAITFQLGRVPPAVSVVYRFVLATSVLFAYCALKALPMRFSRADHGWLALQGFFMFGANYVLVYMSEASISSGLTALLFSTIVFWNLVGMRVFHATLIRKTALMGAILGIAGVALVFGPEISSFKTDAASLRGLACAMAATLSASFGNIVAVRNHRRSLPVMQQNAYGMLYGTLMVIAFVVATGQPFVFETAVPYVASLIYLAVFGSVLAFSAYLTLLGRIGPARAGYISVAIPVVALVLSAVFEGFHWSVETSCGVLLCVLGNVLVLRKGAE